MPWNLYPPRSKTTDFTPASFALGGDCLTHLGRGGEVEVVRPQVRLLGGGGGQRPALDIIDDLGIDVLVASVHSQTGTLTGAMDTLADPGVTPAPGVFA